MSKKDKSTKMSKGTGSYAGTGILEAKAQRVNRQGSVKLKGGINNISVSNAPDQRPAYPHILAVGSSECKGSVMSGVSGPWKATLLNLLGHPSRSHHDNMALYNITRTPGSRQQMTTRLGVTRPLSAKSFQRTAFYTNPEIGGVSTLITPFDALMPTEDWHHEFSYEVGRAVKFLQFCIMVDEVYWQQHQYGGVSYDPGETKDNGHKFTPYERLYNELLSQMPSTQELNIPDHMAENKKLSDLAKAALARLSPVAGGQLADTWVFHDYHHIRQESFSLGMDSLDFGTIIDTDGNVRMMVQLPTTRLAARSTSETFNSVADKVFYDSSKVVEFTGGQAHIAGQNWSTGSGIGTLLYLASLGHMPSLERPHNMPANALWVGDLTLLPGPVGFSAFALVADAGLDGVNNVIAQLNAEHQPFGSLTAEYSPLYADTSQWVLKSERDGATPDQRYYDLREADDFSDVRELSLNQDLANIAQGDSRDFLAEGGNALYSESEALVYANFADGAFFAGYIDEDGNPTATFPFRLANGDPVPEGTTLVYPNNAMWQLIVDEAKKLRVTSKLYTKNIFEVFQYLEAVSAVLPPEYLALGMPRVQAYSLTSGSIDKPKLMDKIIDMKNRDASMRPKFNPVKNISANNGPFWNGASEAFREKNWNAPSQSSGDFEDNKYMIDQLFSNMHIPSGAGENGLPLADVLSMHNPRIATALWTMTQTAVDKNERYVVVPAGRETANNGYMSELGDHKEGHLFDLLYSIWGTFRCDTTFPLYDLDFDAWQLQGIGDGFAAVATTTILPSGIFISEGMGPANGFNQLPTGELTFTTGGAFREPVMDSDLMKFRLRWNRDDFEDEMGVDFQRSDIVLDDGSVTTEYTVDSRVNVATSLLGQRIAVEYGFPSLNAVCVNAQYEEEGVAPIDVETATGLMLIPMNDVEVQPGGWGGKDVRAPGAREYRNTFLPSDGTVIGFRGYDVTPIFGGRFTSVSMFSESFDASGVGEDDGEILATFNVNGGRGAQWDNLQQQLNDRGISHLLGNNAGLPMDEFKAKFDTCAPTLTLVRYTTGGRVPGFSQAVFGAGGFGHQMPLDSELSGFPGTLAPQVHGSIVTYPTAARGNLYALLITWTAAVDDYLCNHQVGAERQTATVATPAAEMAAAFIEDQLMPGDVGGAPRIPPGKLTLDFGGEDDVYTEGYLIPHKENVIVNQRKTELMAAILAYSKGMYSPLRLSDRVGRDMYPYHGTLQGFQRGLIEDIAPHTLKYHRLSVSPLVSEDLERLRVMKHIYSQEDYEAGYTFVTNFLGTQFTSITPNQLLSVQDVITRAGQSGY